MDIMTTIKHRKEWCKMPKNDNNLKIQAEIDPSSISALKTQIRNAVTQSITEGIGERTKFLW